MPESLTRGTRLSLLPYSVALAASTAPAACRAAPVPLPAFRLSRLRQMRLWSGQISPLQCGVAEVQGMQWHSFGADTEPAASALTGLSLCINSSVRLSLIAEDCSKKLW